MILNELRAPHFGMHFAFLCIEHTAVLFPTNGHKISADRVGRISSERSSEDVSSNS